jgi:hypothetical protein
VMEKETQGKWLRGTTGDAVDSRLGPAALYLFSYFQATNSVARLQQAIRFLSCLVDPRLVLLMPIPSRFPTGPELGSFAITPSTNKTWVPFPWLLQISQLGNRELGLSSHSTPLLRPRHPKTSSQTYRGARSPSLGPYKRSFPCSHQILPT